MQGIKVKLSQRYKTPIHKGNKEIGLAVTPRLYPISPVHPYLATFFIQIVCLDTFCMQVYTFGSNFGYDFYAWSKKGYPVGNWGPTKKILILLGINM